MAGIDHVFFNLLTDTFADCPRLVQRRLGQDNHKLLAAVPGKDIDVADAPRYHLGQALQHTVAGLMAIRII